MHILLQETDNCPSWISGRERMTIENISWPNLKKECCRPGGGRTCNLLIASGTRIQLSHRVHLMSTHNMFLWRNKAIIYLDTPFNLSYTCLFVFLLFFLQEVKLPFTTLLAISAGNKLVIFFLFFPENGIWYFMQIGDTIYMKYQILFSGKNNKNISECCLLKFLPRMLDVKHQHS